jgi:hypothetical protein
MIIAASSETVVTAGPEVNVIVIDKNKMVQYAVTKEKPIHSFAPCRSHYDINTVPEVRFTDRSGPSLRSSNELRYILFCDPTRESDFVSTAESWVQVHGSAGYQSYIVSYFYSSTATLSYFKVKRCTT